MKELVKVCGDIDEMKKTRKCEAGSHFNSTTLKIDLELQLNSLDPVIIMYQNDPVKVKT